MASSTASQKLRRPFWGGNTPSIFLVGWFLHPRCGNHGTTRLHLFGRVVFMLKMMITCKMKHLAIEIEDDGLNDDNVLFSNTCNLVPSNPTGLILQVIQPCSCQWHLNLDWRLGVFWSLVCISRNCRNYGFSDSRLRGLHVCIVNYVQEHEMKFQPMIRFQVQDNANTI